MGFKRILTGVLLTALAAITTVKAKASTLSIRGLAFSRAGVDIESVYSRNRRTGITYKDSINPVTKEYTALVEQAQNMDTIDLNYISPAKETVAKTIFVGNTGIRGTSAVVANGNGLGLRDPVTTGFVAEAFGRCYNSDSTDTVYCKFNTKAAPTQIFKIGFDVTSFFGDSVNIEMRAGDYYATSQATIEGKFIGSDTATSPVYLTPQKTFENIRWTSTATQESAYVGETIPAYGWLKNDANLRGETTSVAVKVSRDGVVKHADTLDNIVMEPHPFRDSANAVFSSFVPDSAGTYEFEYSILKKDSIPEDSVVKCTTVVLPETTGIYDQHPQKIIQPQPSTFMTPGYLGNYAEKYHLMIFDDSGRRIRDLNKAGPGIYFAKRDLRLTRKEDFDEIIPEKIIIPK